MKGLSRTFSKSITIAIVGTSLSCFTGCGNGNGDIPLPVEEGTGIGGSIAFDGSCFWAMRVPLNLQSKREREIVKFDRSGSLISTYEPEENVHGIAFDGAELWTSESFGSKPAGYFGHGGHIYTIDPASGVLSQEFAIAEDYQIDAFTAGGDRLWAYVAVSSERGSKRFIYEIDPASESIVARLPFPESESRTCSGMTYANGYLWLVSGLLKREILKIDPQTGKVIERKDYTGRVINGITTVGGKIYLVDGDKHVLFAM